MTNNLWLFFLLLFLHQEKVDGCKKSSCKPTQFRCPTGKEYKIEREMIKDKCFVVRGQKGLDEIIENCWSDGKTKEKRAEQKIKAKTCIRRRADACSAGPLINVLNALFETACNTHDLCYNTKGKEKKFCDVEFRKNLLDSCNSGSWSYDYGYCIPWAHTAYTAVKQYSFYYFQLSFGSYGYNEGQKDGCWRRGEPSTKRNKNIIDQDKDNFDLVLNYKEFQGNCWDFFGRSTDSLWNTTQLSIKHCKSKKNKKNAVKCWKKIGNNLKVELQKDKAYLIDCVDIQENTTEEVIMDPRTMKNLKNLNKKDLIQFKKSEFRSRASKSETVLRYLAEDAVEKIEKTWQQNEENWNKCWRKSMKVLRKRGIKKAAKKIRNCWKMEIDNNIREELDINTIL